MRSRQPALFVNVKMASSLIPEVYYARERECIPDALEEFKSLFNTSESKLDGNLGIRVFYFNVAMAKSRTCDHPHSDGYSEEWKCKLEMGEAVEAGTTVDITDYTVRKTTKEQHFMVVVQWDCGAVKSYTEDEFKYLRVFDLGPTGMY